MADSNDRQIDISDIDARVSRVMDLKTPGSGEQQKNRIENIDLLTPHDQIKFVLYATTTYVCTCVFRDLAIQKRENDLVGASFGRGFYVLDDYSPLRESSPELFKEKEFHIFPVRPALWYVESDRLGGRRGFQGDAYYTADNPPYGATFTYYLLASIERTTHCFKHYLV